MIFCFYFIPLFAVVNTLLSCYLVFIVFKASPYWRKVFADAVAADLRQLIEKNLDEEGPLQSFLEQRYEGFIGSLKQRIPMAEMFLTGSLEASLKEQARSEITRLMPEFKQLISDRFLRPEEIQEWVKAKLDDQSLAHIQKKFLRRAVYSLVAISLSFGLVELLLFLMVC